MKINPKINKRVNESMAECRKVLTEATIELLKTLKAKDSQGVVFGRVLILFQSNGNVSTTILADRIAYLDGRGDNPFYIVFMGDTGTASSLTLSISNMQIIYNEVRRVVREE